MHQDVLSQLKNQGRKRLLLFRWLLILVYGGGVEEKTILISRALKDCTGKIVFFQCASKVTGAAVSSS